MSVTSQRPERKGFWEDNKEERPSEFSNGEEESFKAVVELGAHLEGAEEYV